MTNKEMMLSSNLYLASDKELKILARRGRTISDKINKTKTMDFKKREKLARKMFAYAGTNLNINKPFYVDYGSNIEIGNNFFANFNCTMLDVCKITIGNNVMLASNVALYTATHPLDKNVRNSGLELGYPITIGDNVWIGGNVVINPGVTIGNNTVIGSGSVVVKDIPSDVLAAGNPARVIRSLTKDDYNIWKNHEKFYYDNIKKD
ncbi:sugar O-acetyltransferase [Haploplasma modicum]|uniref:sugar O-acetyltransferase n=1 Tax=Haploplasma modicum TaxID=2150 RepID=UPI00047DD065|nr:sugar O-acetyltransferase [Haploplasma modicum]